MVSWCSSVEARLSEFQVLPQILLSSSSGCCVLWLPPTVISPFGIICHPIHKQAQKYLATTTLKKSMPSTSPGSPGQCCSNRAWCYIDTIMVGKSKATPFGDHRTREVRTVGRWVDEYEVRNCGQGKRNCMINFNLTNSLLDGRQWQLLWSYCPLLLVTSSNTGALRHAPDWSSIIHQSNDS